MPPAKKRSHSAAAPPLAPPLPPASHLMADRPACLIPPPRPLPAPGAARCISTTANNASDPLPAEITVAGGGTITIEPSPVNVSHLSHLLTDHPDPSLCARVVSRFVSGADIGYRGGLTSRFCSNNRSATSRPDAVSRAIQLELARGHTYGPFRIPPLPHFRVNPLSAREKPDGSVRLLLDMSQPTGQSINDGISRVEFSVSYTSLDEAVRLIFVNGGQGALLAKADVKHAFRLVPVRRDQWQLQGFCWAGHFYFDTRLVFGSRSSPRIFNDFADCLTWLFVRHSGNVAIRHYLDDFFAIGPRGSDACHRAYHSFLDVSRQLGVPLAPSKCLPPATRLELLGVILDTDAMTVSLPPAKLAAILDLLRALRSRDKCTKRELLSVGGKLAHAATCVPPGRAFTRRILDAAYSVDRLGHRVRITRHLRRDLDWWGAYLPLWNGDFPLIPPPAERVYLVDVFTDSSERGGAAHHQNNWFMLHWPAPMIQTPDAAMTWLEMIPVVVALLVWGAAWHGHRIRLHCDNMGVIAVWRRGWSRNPLIMDLIRHLSFICARNRCHLDMVYVASRSNTLADALSRGRLDTARRVHPALSTEPTPIPNVVHRYLASPATSAYLLSGHPL